ncbi:hypothetical protein QR680_014806 [Steinernema hermaphroditum]|uniref:Cullin N-terminal domain-containing protein n=1 Tax=Steinernema hermaphroditum TaxID=289476 RepID=A0AA39IBR6_9BILA|nr:hypothetical protein QR680_014806 [Steinernema hermaphroditum]
MATFKTSWMTIKPTLEKILSTTAITRKEFVVVLQIIHDLCNMDWHHSQAISKAELLYYSLDELITEYVSNKALELEICENHEGRLREYESAWRKFKKSIEVLSVIFRSFNNHWAGSFNNSLDRNESHRQVTDTSTLCIDIWKREMLEKSCAAIKKSIDQMKLNLSANTGSNWEFHNV